jgi:hypothetical protein
MGRLRCRVLPILRDARPLGRAPQDEAEGADGRISCKQQGICRRFTSMAACSAATRPSPNEKSRLRRPVWRLSSASRWREACRSHAMGPTLAGAGRNSDCGFSPIPFWRGRQKTGCQESCWTDDGSDRQRSQPQKPNGGAEAPPLRIGRFLAWPFSASTAASWPREARAAFPSRPPDSSPPFAPSRRPAPRSGARVRARPRTRRPGPRA